MKGMQYTITRLDNGLQAQWEENTILFDTQEEAEEMITLFPDFFKTPKGIEIKKGIYFIDNSINYKDLKEREDFKKEVEVQKDLDSDVIRATKNCKGEIIMPVIEISYAKDEEEIPEHYGYYDNVEDAKKALDDIAKELKSEEEE